MATLIAINSVLRIDIDPCHGFYRTLCQHSGKGVHFLGFMKPLALDSSTEIDPACSSLGKDVNEVLSNTHVAMVESPPMPRRAAGEVCEVATKTLVDWLESGEAKEVEVAQLARQTLPLGRMTKSVQSNAARRQALVEPFLDPQRLANALILRSGLSPMVRQVMGRGCSRATAYRLWALLCLYGFDSSAVVVAFEMCGAPGRSRPVTETRRKAGRKSLREKLGMPEVLPQRGLTEKDRQTIVRLFLVNRRPQTSLRKVYERIILEGYVDRYEPTLSGLKPVMPLKGTFPNARQIRHVIETEVTKLEQVRLSTTEGHFDRNLRGLKGKSYDDASGPGHTFAIDSTIADMYLRSSVNRNWLIGRPIVYIVVDVWSTAVVGFYISLSWPSWATAKIALFCTLCNPALLSELWGCEHVGALNPTPALPFRLLSDRGEYLSQGARETGLELGLNAAFNPSYRPDLKGLVEVLNRIVKDEQYTSFVPGAMDARRKELELRPDLRESALTVREYAHYLHLTFTQYNLFADRGERMTGEMIAADVTPSPAGLWRFGHEAGLGYRKRIPESRLISALLPSQEVVVRRNGIYMSQLQYQSDAASALHWTAQARNFGAFEQRMHHFPGSVSRLWWPNPKGGLENFTLTPGARVAPDTILDEWVDALMAQKLKRNDHVYSRLVSRLELVTRTTQMFDVAKRATTEAEQSHIGAAMPHFRDVRRLESLLGPADELVGAGTSPPEEISLSDHASASTEADPYDDCKRELLRQLNQEDPTDEQ